MTTYRVLSDLLYRSVATVTTSNVVTEAYDCDAYGNTLCYSGPGTDGAWFTDDDVRTNSPVNTAIFTGRQYDPESQIYYYRARYYSPQIGRFISRDPLKRAEKRQGPNLYWYVRNRAVNFVDPLGLQQFPGPQGNPCNALDLECVYATSNVWQTLEDIFRVEQALNNTASAAVRIAQSAMSDAGTDIAIDQSIELLLEAAEIEVPIVPGLLSSA